MSATEMILALQQKLSTIAESWKWEAYITTKKSIYHGLNAGMVAVRRPFQLHAWNSPEHCENADKQLEAVKAYLATLGNVQLFSYYSNTFALIDPAHLAELPEPACLPAGTPATCCFHTDRVAGYIIGTKSPTEITFQEGAATLLNGSGSGEPDALTFTPGGFVGHVSGTQRWTVDANPTGTMRTFTLRKNGRWIQKGQSQEDGPRLILGHNHHYDFNF